MRSAAGRGDLAAVGAGRISVGATKGWVIEGVECFPAELENIGFVKPPVLGQASLIRRESKLETAAEGP